jgi:hypothetical protein
VHPPQVDKQAREHVAVLIDERDPRRLQRGRVDGLAAGSGQRAHYHVQARMLELGRVRGQNAPERNPSPSGWSFRSS